MDNNDGIEEEGLDMDEASFDEFEEKKGTLGSFLRDNPLAKVGVIAGVVVIIFGAIILLGGENAPLDPSFVGAGSDVSAPPGTEAASQDYIDAIQEVNERDVEIAQQTGGSALPTPIEPPVGTLTVPDQAEAEEDPLQRWRRLQEERVQRELQQSQTIDPAPIVEDTGRAESIQALADLMSQQMQAVLDSRENTISHRTVISTSDFFRQREEEQLRRQEARAAAGVDVDSDAQDEEIVETVLLNAGEIVYAQLLNEANSDVPGPVLAQIMSGPLKGTRVLGSFERQDDYLTLSFNSAVIDGTTVSINAVAMDPDTTLPGLATDVDHRYLQRILLPAAAAFVEGAASAIADSGLTTVTIQGETVAEETEETDSDQEIASGIEEAGQELREIFDDELDDIEVLVRVEAGTPMGLLFTEPVVIQDNAI